MTYDTTRTYCVSDTKPENPIVYDFAVIFIDDIQDEGTDEEGNHSWSYIQTQIMPIKEYLPLLKADAVTQSYGNTIELIEELRPE